MDLRVSHFANPYNIDQSDAYLGIMAFILYFNIKIKKKSGFSFFLLLNKHTVKKYKAFFQLFKVKSENKSNDEWC